MTTIGIGDSGHVHGLSIVVTGAIGDMRIAADRAGKEWLPPGHNEKAPPSRRRAGPRQGGVRLVLRHVPSVREARTHARASDTTEHGYAREEPAPMQDGPVPHLAHLGILIRSTVTR